MFNIHFFLVISKCGVLEQSEVVYCYKINDRKGNFHKVHATRGNLIMWRLMSTRGK